MANTTNFGWETPDDTDLVKDGALAMRTLGQAIDTSLVDLKGGTTGQVLSKNTNTDMDFTWVTPNDADAIQNSIVDAKGDLISASAADTPARLASSGVNGDVLTVDTSTATGLKWATPSGSSGPAFRAFRNTSQQSFNQNTATKVQFNGESFDTDNCFDSTTNYRFTPNKAGYYQISSNVTWSGAGSETIKELYIYKNGSRYTDLFSSNGSGKPGATCNNGSSSLVYLNGTTDYVEIFIYDSDASVRNVLNGEAQSHFSGVWIRS